MQCFCPIPYVPPLQIFHGCNQNRINYNWFFIHKAPFSIHLQPLFFPTPQYPSQTLIYFPTSLCSSSNCKITLHVSPSLASFQDYFLEFEPQQGATHHMICIFVTLSPARSPIPSNQRVVSSTMISIAFPHTGYTSELFASFIYALSPKPINSIQLPRSGRGSIGLSNTFIALCADLKELSRLPIWSDCFK